ncbi:MAG: carbonic anhydrase [Elusimicrobia bacterium]|nr:carbonic anhydrase [Elusimicrobiota bacterium]
MKKLIKGIMDFRKTRQPLVRETFARLALGQFPDALFIACSDSRVAANVFASTDPGDLFVIRNVGNIMPPHPDTGSAVAGLEFAIHTLKVRHIIVCGHSDCGAMRALAQNGNDFKESPLDRWLRHAKAATDHGVADQDTLSKINVALQLSNLRTHPAVKDMEKSGDLTLHGLWFDIRKADVYYLENPPIGYVLIDDTEGEKILHRLKD